MAKTKIKPEIKGLYYITHIENLPSILSRGIFSHRCIEDRGVEYKAIYDASSDAIMTVASEEGFTCGNPAAVKSKARGASRAPMKPARRPIAGSRYQLCVIRILWRRIHALSVALAHNHLDSRAILSIATLLPRSGHATVAYIIASQH